VFHSNLLFGKMILYSFGEQCRKSTEIFTGRIIQMTAVNERKSEYGDFKTFKIVFKTISFWKGSVCDTISCLAYEGICSSNIFEIGKNYLVYSNLGEINLGSGRSGSIEFDFIRSDIKKLGIRYLFRRPQKLKTDKDLSSIKYSTINLAYSINNREDFKFTSNKNISIHNIFNDIYLTLKNSVFNILVIQHKYLVNLIANEPTAFKSD